MDQRLILIPAILFSFAAVGASPLDSVNTKRSRTFIGFKLGLTSTEMLGTDVNLHTQDPDSYFETEPGIELGMVVKHEFTSWLYLKTELYYTQNKGYVRHDNFVYPFTAELGFLNIPLLFGLQVPGPFSLGIEGGLSVNINGGSNDSFSNGLHPDNEVSRNSIIPAAILGGNLDIAISDKAKLMINYRYMTHLDYYFSRTYTVTNPDQSWVYDVWINSHSGTIGLLFKI